MGLLGSTAVKLLAKQVNSNSMEGLPVKESLYMDLDGVFLWREKLAAPGKDR